jgi:drug/metabolite transporter (DMT)-like permease
VTFGVLAVAAVFALVLGAAIGDFAAVRSLSPRGLAALLYLAIPGQALGQWFWQEGVARLGAARAGVYLYLEPLATLALAVPLLGEHVTLWTGLGGALILAGVYLGQNLRFLPMSRHARQCSRG